jgi:hypothetical protein
MRLERERDRETLIFGPIAMVLIHSLGRKQESARFG